MSQFLPHVDVKEAPLVAQLVKNPPAVQETLVRFLGQERAVVKNFVAVVAILFY